jgi:hypothetical protein
MNIKQLLAALTFGALLVGLSHKKLEFTSYVFNPGWSDPTVIVELRWSF